MLPWCPKEWIFHQGPGCLWHVDNITLRQHVTARSTRRAYPLHPASWGCPGTSPPLQRRCSDSSQGHPRERRRANEEGCREPRCLAEAVKQMGGWTAVLLCQLKAQFSVEKSSRDCTTTEFYLSEFVVFDELRSVSVDQGIESKTILPAAREEGRVRSLCQHRA